MELLAVSKDTIRARVIRYFHDVFHTPISAFKPDTKVRNAYSYSDRAWSQLANVFNKLSWMRQLDVLLSPNEMDDYKTIDDITNAIWKKLKKVISVSALSPRFKMAAVRKFAAPKRRSAAKPTSSGRSKKRGKKQAVELVHDCKGDRHAQSGRYRGRLRLPVLLCLRRKRANRRSAAFRQRSGLPASPHQFSLSELRREPGRGIPAG
jgi:hypothetical protein